MFQSWRTELGYAGYLHYRTYRYRCLGRGIDSTAPSIVHSSVVNLLVFCSISVVLVAVVGLVVAVFAGTVRNFPLVE